jgi:hypothetical protein
MTAACSGGTSGPKAGQAAQVRYSSGLIAELLAIYDTLWLIPIIPLLTLPDLALSVFCSNDPPAMPTLTAAEVNALLNLQLGPDFLSGLQKTSDAILHMTWYNACECTSGTLVTLVPPTQPAGATVIQGPTGPAATQCAGGVIQGAFTWGQQPQLCDNVASICPIPANASMFHLDSNMAVSAAGLTGLRHHIDQYNATNQLVFSNQFDQPQSQLHFTADFPPVATASRYIYYVIPLGVSGGQWTGTARISIFCGGQTSGAQQPCCPPDTSTQSYLDAIYRLVSLIQRQSAPFAYVQGNAHTGLTGNGEITVSEVLGMKLQPGALPPDAGVVLGDPDTLWLDSWINWGNADGWTAREFLRASPHLSLPPLAGQFTRLGYSLRPGLVVDATELVRGW